MCSATGKQGPPALSCWFVMLSVPLQLLCFCILMYGSFQRRLERSDRELRLKRLKKTKKTDGFSLFLLFYVFLWSPGFPNVSEKCHDSAQDWSRSRTLLADVSNSSHEHAVSHIPAPPLECQWRADQHVNTCLGQPTWTTLWVNPHINSRGSHHSSHTDVQHLKQSALLVFQASVSKHAQVQHNCPSVHRRDTAGLATGPRPTTIQTPALYHLSSSSIHVGD
jgi:hypothetical protein